jgi:hypothetical protein
MVAGTHAHSSMRSTIFSGLVLTACGIALVVLVLFVIAHA